MLRNLSWPAVSHSCSLTFRPSRCTFFVTKDAPVEEIVLFESNLPWIYRCNKLVFPTPEGEKRGEERRVRGMTEAVAQRQLTTVAHDYNLGIDGGFVH